MRLICPNCGAQYEVAADSVPATGRDVQCSNCGHTWFESPGASVAAEQELASTESAAAGLVAATTSLDDAAGEAATNPLAGFGEGFEDETDDVSDAVSRLMGSQGGDKVSAALDGAGDAASDLADKAKEGASALADKASDAAESVGRSVPKHELEDSVAEILKQEADLELGARQSEISSLETQTDIPMDPPEAEDRGSETRDRLARLKGQTETANVAAVSSIAAAAAASGKEVLPDIDEINSTLRTNAERGEAVAPPPEQVEKVKRKGFRWGFWGILFLILLAVLVYLFAAQIINMVPATEGAITGYVDTINGLRGWVNGQAESAITSLETDADTVASE